MQRWLLPTLILAVSLLVAVPSRACTISGNGDWNSSSATKLTFPVATRLGEAPENFPLIVIGEATRQGAFHGERIGANNPTKVIITAISVQEILKGKSDATLLVKRFPAFGGPCNNGPLLRPGREYVLFIKNSRVFSATRFNSAEFQKTLYEPDGFTLAADYIEDAEWLAELRANLGH